MKQEISRARLPVVAAGFGIIENTTLLGAEPGATLAVVVPQPTALAIILVLALFYFGFRWRTE